MVKGTKGRNRKGLMLHQTDESYNVDCFMDFITYCLLGSTVFPINMK